MLNCQTVKMTSQTKQQAKALHIAHSTDDT